MQIIGIIIIAVLYIIFFIFMFFYFPNNSTFHINRFTLVDLGEVGRHSHGGVFSHSSFGEALEDGSLVLPEPAPLPATTGPHLPFVLVGDEAFPLKNYMLRPYPGRNLPGT